MGFTTAFFSDSTAARLEMVIDMSRMCGLCRSVESAEPDVCVAWLIIEGATEPSEWIGFDGRILPLTYNTE